MSRPHTSPLSALINVGLCVLLDPFYKLIYQPDRLGRFLSMDPMTRIQHFKPHVREE